MSLTRKASSAAKKPTKPPRQDLAAALAEREAELEEARRQQAAVSEVLEIVNNSQGDLVAVSEAIVERAMPLCGAAGGGLWAVDGEMARAVCGSISREPYFEFLARGPFPFAQIFGRAARNRPFLHVEDLGQAYHDGQPLTVATVELGGVRPTSVFRCATAIRSSGSSIWCAGEVRPFTDRQIAIAQGFASQAQIAMKSARLFNEGRKRWRGKPRRPKSCG